MTATEITLRTADHADQVAVTDLIQELNRFEAAITGDRREDRAAAEACYRRMQERVSTRRGRIILAERAGRIIGVIAFVVQEDEPFVTEAVRLHCFVTDLVVDEDHRGAGVGRRLLAEVERLARESGCRRLAIGVLAGNGGALRAYEAFGFEDYARTLVKGLD